MNADALRSSSPGGSNMNTTLADRMGFQWAGIEGAMKFANRNPAFRHHVESLVDTYFDLIDEMAAELERRRMFD